MLQRRQMERLPALHLAVVSLLGFCCLIHASRAAISFPPGNRLMLSSYSVLSSDNLFILIYMHQRPRGCSCRRPTLS
uniref:Uncharacterized protein n=1 Tax=Aegilops tauschii subsp. strangulata TaxID=200361 RepID=A0A452ZW42_AEGTS